MTEYTTITDYEVMFTIHTGVTLLFAKQDILTTDGEENLTFSVLDEKKLVISAGKGGVLIEEFKLDYLEEARMRKFVMLYELENEEVVRCTPCHMK